MGTLTNRRECIFTRRTIFTRNFGIGVPNSARFSRIEINSLITNRLIDNIENYTSEKYLFICNFFDDDKQKNLNAAEYRIDEYIKYNMSTNEKIYNELDVQESLRKIAFLLI